MHLIYTEQTDSAIDIVPAKENEKLVNLIQSIIAVLSPLPYSFIQAIGLKNLTFCQDVHIHNPKYIQHYETRLSNGLFVINQLDSPDLVFDHFYRVIIYHIVKIDRSFCDSWTEMLNHINPFKKPKFIMRDMLDTFKLMLQSRQRVE